MSSVKKQKISKIQSEYTYNQEMKQDHLLIRKKKLIRRLIGIGICACFLSVVIGYILLQQSHKVDQRIAQRVQLEDQLLELQKEEKILKEEIKKLENDEYIAKIARNEYFLSNEGEVIFKVAE